MINQRPTDLEVIRKLVVDDEEDVAYAEGDDPAAYGESINLNIDLELKQLQVIPTPRL